MKTKYFAIPVSLSGLGFAIPTRRVGTRQGTLGRVPYVVQVGGTRITAGNYKVAWQGTGPCGRGEFLAVREACGHGARNLEDE